FNVGLPVGESMTLLVIDGFGGRFSGLGVIANRILEGREDAYHGSLLTSNPAELVIRVTPTSVKVTCDGKQIVNWTGNASELTIRRQFWNYRDDAIFLGSWNSEFILRSATIRSL
ncbi:MAG: hypothetical protein R3C19_04040, partial [Planctomycetaceae bacterium]